MAARPGLPVNSEYPGVPGGHPLPLPTNRTAMPFSSRQRLSGTYPPKQASATSPEVIALAVGEAFSAMDGAVVTAVQAVCTLLPGCSGNVVPGCPASAHAEPGTTATSAENARVPITRRFIRRPSLPTLDTQNAARSSSGGDVLTRRQRLDAANFFALTRLRRLGGVGLPRHRSTGWGRVSAGPGDLGPLPTAKVTVAHSPAKP